MIDSYLGERLRRVCSRHSGINRPCPHRTSTGAITAISQQAGRARSYSKWPQKESAYPGEGFACSLLLRVCFSSRSGAALWSWL
jgi:hypothetical protein